MSNYLYRCLGFDQMLPKYKIAPKPHQRGRPGVNPPVAYTKLPSFISFFLIWNGFALTIYLFYKHRHQEDHPKLPSKSPIPFIFQVSKYIS